MDFLANNWLWILLGGFALWFLMRGRGLGCGMGHSHGDPTSHTEHTEAPGHQGEANQQPPQPAPERRRHGCC